MRSAQQQRIATETSEEIEARRARDRRNHMDLKTAEVPLFQQTCVRFKMRQFHSRLKSVCVPRCVTKVRMYLCISSAVHNPSRTAAIHFSIYFLTFISVSCHKSSTCFFFSDISIFLRRKCFTRFFFSDISIFPNLYAGTRYTMHAWRHAPWIRQPWKVPSTHRDFRVRRSVVHRALNWLSKLLLTTSTIVATMYTSMSMP